MGLLRARVRTSAAAAFFLASPVLDPVLILALGWLFVVWVAVWFTVFLTAAVLVAASVAERMHLERLVLDRALVPAGSPAPPSGDLDTCEAGEPAWRGWPRKRSWPASSPWPRSANSSFHSRSRVRSGC